MRSLQSRLMIGTAVATLAIFLSAAVTLFFLTRAELLRDFDATTLAKARTIISMTEVDGDHVNIEGLAQFPEFQRARHPDYFEIRTRDGLGIFKSVSLKDHDLKQPTAKQLASSKGKSVDLPDGESGRELSVAFAAHSDEDSVVSPKFAPGLVLTMARDSDSLNDLLADFGWLLAIVCGAAIVVMLGVTMLVIRRGLKPVNDLASNIERIGESNLSDRLAESTIPRELSPIVTRLNDLLGRLSSAFEREKSFTADAAHELRTPLAGLESALEVCLRKPRSGEGYEAVVRDCLDVVRQMHSMVDSLLLLSRADASLVKVSPSEVSIAAMLKDAWRQFEDRAHQRDLHIAWNLKENLTLVTDREKLLSIVTNLLSNAVHYTNTRGTIEMAADQIAEQVEIKISNSGSAVSAEDAAHVFDRFWRGDSSRSDTGTNCGLGLAVCQKLTMLLGGSIAVESAAGGDFVVRMIFPAMRKATLVPSSEQRIDFRGADKVVD